MTSEEILKEIRASRIHAGHEMHLCRFDSHDLDDAKFLLRHLEITTPEQAFRIIEQYYPRHVIPPKTQFLLEELLGSG